MPSEARRMAATLRRTGCEATERNGTSLCSMGNIQATDREKLTQPDPEGGKGPLSPQLQPRQAFPKCSSAKPVGDW